MEVVVSLALFIAPYVLAFVLNRKRKRALKERDEALSHLERYRPIIDMELHTQRLLDEAEEQAQSLNMEAERVMAQAEERSSKIVSEAEQRAHELRVEAARMSAKAERKMAEATSEAQSVADAMKAEARDRLKQAKEKAEQIEKTARDESERVISYANKRAEEIAGGALEAKDKADLYESTIRAMRNAIEGYKDDYIVPNQSVLDDLADEYSHKDAGEQLKNARQRVKDLVKKGHAADCDYAEQNRRTYAIHFVVDAFNGKVDSALSKVKHDNYGKIKQEIIDAFALVNHNGMPFRNARIHQEYLDARLDELRWAVAVYELQLQEREEQRAIREQMREEERAQKEMEKALREAEKEERLIQKALEKARSELASASEEQRQQYEAQLAELEQKLKEAEERGQRAISMAQQTRRGHVYVISNIGSFGEHVYKVGMTRRLEPLDRVKELGDASVPFDFDVHAMIYSDDAPTLEKDLHRLFELRAVNRVNPRKEFFRANLAEIRQAVENHGISDIHWTMKAEAVEYRETQSIIKREQEMEPAIA